MTGIFGAQGEVVAKLVPGGARGLAHLSDEELLTSTRRLVGRSNQPFAALLVHLAEVDARGLHRTRRCASLYTYCIYELRFSEDEAFRRASAAKLVKEFPILFDAIAGGELHLTGLLMLGPHLTLENHVEVLARAKFRTKRELARLVRELHPLPLIPDRVEPLGPQLPQSPRNPGWEHWAAVLAGPYRELPAGERPRDWNDPARHRSDQPGDESDDDSIRDMRASSGLLGTAPARVEPLPEAPLSLPPITAPQQYELQFTTVEEHVRLVERAKAPLARGQPSVGLGELHLQAMRLLVADLEKRRFAVNPRRVKAAAVATADNAMVAASVTAAPAEQAIARDVVAAAPTDAPLESASAASLLADASTVASPTTPRVTGTSPPQCAAWSSSATTGAAPSSIRMVAAARRNATWSSITCSRLRDTAPMSPLISRYAAARTTRWPPRKSSVAPSSPSSEHRYATNHSQRKRRSTARSAVPNS